MMYVLVGIAVAMAFLAGVEYVLWATSKRECKRLRGKCESLAREIRRRENGEKIVKEIDR